MDDIRAKLGENAKAWALILNQTEDADLKQIQIMAMIFDFFLRDDEKGFADTHLVIVNGSDDDTPPSGSIIIGKFI